MPEHEIGKTYVAGVAIDNDKEKVERKLPENLSKEGLIRFKEKYILQVVNFRREYNQQYKIYKKAKDRIADLNSKKLYAEDRLIEVFDKLK